jgi:hypothetical protein
MANTLIQVKPHRNAWKVFEGAGVEPVFLQERQALDYAESRACFRSGEIHLINAKGEIERIVVFNEAHRRL